MVTTYDVGSMPLRSGEDIIRRGARASQTLLPLLISGAGSEDLHTFEEELIGAFVDKLRAGIDTPNYPQFRDMNEMFFDLMRGVEKGAGGHVAVRPPTAMSGASIPEVDIIKRNASRISDLLEGEPFNLKVCVTGPYTLASFFRIRDAKLIRDLGRAVAEIASRSLFEARKARVAMLFVDEPVLGFLNDPLLDFGSEGRMALLDAWEGICRVASARGTETGIHLHDTSDRLFWDVEHLNVVESHVDDPLYTSDAVKARLDETDKRLKASVCTTIFDDLIAERLRAEHGEGDTQQRLGETWSAIRRGLVDPFTFLEDQELIQSRLRRVFARFGTDRVPYAGTECGLSSFPTYECAIECLRRVTVAVERYNSTSAKAIE
jgi:5-methyltetrahydropteroyltriglutamate--homocysteine methyltransferase